MTSPRAPRALHLFALAWLALTLLAGQEAWVSQVHYEGVPLAEVLEQAPTVLRGQLADPPHRRVELRYPTTDRAGQAVEGRYAFALLRVEVKELLAGAGPSVGEIVELYTPELVTGFGLHLRYESTGVSKSPIYQRLEGGELPWEARQDGLFLLDTGAVARGYGGEDAEAWAALTSAISGATPLAIGDGAWPLSRRAELEALLAPPPEPPPPPDERPPPPPPEPPRPPAEPAGG